MSEKLVNAIADMREEEALTLVKEMVEGGSDPMAILDSARDAMAIVGQRYEQKEYYLPELIMAGEILQQISALVKPMLAGKETRAATLGTVVIGTVAGDIHDLGKDIVVFMLEANDFEVHDLGIDVPAQRFTEKIAEVKPEVVGLSGFLTLAFDQMRDTVDAIREAGLRDSVKIMIGGAPMDEAVTRYIGADAYGPDAAAAVRLAKGWVGGSE